MTAACFFRYAWIAPARFEALLPPSPALERLSEHLPHGTEVAAALPESARRSGAIVRLRDFAERPLLNGLPLRSLVRSAMRWATAQGETAAARLAGWCEALRVHIDECVDADADDARDRVFLDALSHTDFPVLLLWSNPDLARHLFVDDGGVALAPHLSSDPKARRKAATAALRYALGTFGRFGPRGGWIGSGFGMLDGGDGATSVRRSDERLVIEPDIGWAARTWFPDDAGGIVPGEDAWSHLRRKLKEAPAKLAAVERLQDEAAGLGGEAWSFAAVDAFLTRTAARLAETVEAGRWRGDPHLWWLSRVATRELRLRPDLLADADRLYAARRAELGRAGVPAGRPAPTAGPLPLRLARGDASTLICEAEEFTDWVVRAESLRRGGAFLPEAAPRAAAVVIHVEGSRGRYRLHEPNPRRTADIAARHLDGRPRYLGCDDAGIAVAPPDDLSDQRLLRPDADEVPLAQVPAGSDAMLRLPLAGAHTAAHLARELASPRYAAAPDLVPIQFDERAARPLSFGRVDPVSRVWLLAPDEARALAADAKGPSRLAAFYRQELHAALGSPRWIGLLVAGKLSRMPTASPVAFRPLLHACRIAASPIVVRADADHAIRPPLVDGEGAPLACEIYVARADPPPSLPAEAVAAADRCMA